MYFPIGISSQVVVSGNEACGYGNACPYMMQQMCVSDEVPKKEKKVEESLEELSKKTHEERLQILTKENQLLAYELEQAKLKYSIHKLVSETQKLTIFSSEATTETDNEIDI